MTCAHVVHVALKKVSGVDSVDVSLNKGLATVKLKPGNAVSVQQLWQLIHQQGYTPKSTAVSARGDLENSPHGLQLKVSGTNQIIALAPDAKNGTAYADATKKVGHTVIVQGTMTPAKDLQAPVPLQVTETK